MKTPEQMNRCKKNRASASTLMIVIIMLLIATSCGANKSALPYHESLQKEYSYQPRNSANRAFTLASAKEDLKDAKAKKRRDEKKAREQTKIDAIIKEIQDLKSN